MEDSWNGLKHVDALPLHPFFKGCYGLNQTMRAMVLALLWPASTTDSFMDWVGLTHIGEAEATGLTRMHYLLTLALTQSPAFQAPGRQGQACARVDAVQLQNGNLVLCERPGISSEQLKDLSIKSLSILKDWARHELLATRGHIVDDQDLFDMVNRIGLAIDQKLGNAQWRDVESQIFESEEYMGVAGLETRWKITKNPTHLDILPVDHHGPDGDVLEQQLCDIHGTRKKDVSA